MKRLIEWLQRVSFSRAESIALLTTVSLYLVGFTWRYVQQSSYPIDSNTYATLDSLIASGGMVPTDSLPKPKGDTLRADASAPDTLSASDRRIRINAASFTQLLTLPGIGPALANRILEYRLKNGPFKRIGDLTFVSGIGPAKLGRLESLVTVD